MNISNLTIGQKEALFESLKNQKSPMTDAEKRTLEALRPTIKVIEIKRTRVVNTQCSWDKTITTYKSCVLLFCNNGKYTRLKLENAQTHVTNMRIKEASFGYRLIK